MGQSIDFRRGEHIHRFRKECIQLHRKTSTNLCSFSMNVQKNNSNQLSDVWTCSESLALSLDVVRFVLKKARVSRFDQVVD